LIGLGKIARAYHVVMPGLPGITDPPQGTKLLWANCFVTGRSLCGIPNVVHIAAAIANAVRM
jgi:hypothetical protein